MKYRRLAKDELEELESEFIRFLATHMVTASDWEELKADKPKKADGLIQIFSDQVFQQVLNRVEYLEFRSPRDLKIFHCGSDQMEMVGLKVEGETELDLTQNQAPETMMQLLRLSGAQLKLLHGTKGYQKERELELFHLMESGARISRDKSLFQLLKGLKLQGGK
jgi:hypothetical protein